MFKPTRNSRIAAALVVRAEQRTRVGTPGQGRPAMKPWLTLAALALAAAIWAMATPAHADCPVAERTMSEREQQAIVSMSEVIRQARPAAPAGWSLKEPAATPKNAPTPGGKVCGNSDVPPGWFGTYVWDEQSKRNLARQTEQNAKLKAADAYTPQEQQEMGELSRQARDLERKAIGLMHTNPAESARLRAEMKPFTERAYALRKAHDERVHPQLQAIHKEYAAGVAHPVVNVSAYLYEVNPIPEGLERLQIPGAATTYVDERKRELVMTFGRFPPAKDSGGISAKPRVLVVTVQGDRGPAETIAKVIAASSLATLGRA